MDKDKKETKNDKKTNGEGSVRYIESKERYEARFRCVNPLNGKAERKSFYNEKKSVALKQGREWVRTMKEGLYPTGDKVKLSEWIDIWLRDFVEPSVRTKTYEKYESCMNCYIKPRIGDYFLTKIEAGELQALFRQLLIDGSAKKTALSSSVVLSTRRYLKQCMELAVEMGLITKNPCRATKAVKLETKGISILYPAQIKQLIKIMNNDITAAEKAIEDYGDNPGTNKAKNARLLKVKQTGDCTYDSQKDGKLEEWWYALFRLRAFKMLIVLALGTGMRAGELLGLSWYAVNKFDKEPSVDVLRSLSLSNNSQKFVEPKTKYSRRKVLISQYLVDELCAYEAWQQEYMKRVGDIYKNQSLVFANTVGGPIVYSKMTKEFRKLKGKIGAYNVRFHDLRHTHASYLLMKGVNPKVVQERLGHATILITLDTYSHLIPSMQQTAVAATDELFAE